jgi:hypothetical protein
VILAPIQYRELETLIVERATEVDPKGVLCPETAADVRGAAISFALPSAIVVVSSVLLYRRVCCGSG